MKTVSHISVAFGDPELAYASIKELSSAWIARVNSRAKNRLAEYMFLLYPYIKGYI
ncbi:hypothetical protein GCM10007853_08150 [Algimonas ampicilliniresistens]|uniref:Uncharacterized protein n=1 Tax=Algimonas ampicilliniresistens TaxID=1298735 RepID=A0ABQ5V8L7_9PROT|nr:hypothetical protein GCM10007853_08150 [Algimonas ampicilliniresistens]